MTFQSYVIVSSTHKNITVFWTFFTKVFKWTDAFMTKNGKTSKILLIKIVLT